MHPQWRELRTVPRVDGLQLVLRARYGIQVNGLVRLRAGVPTLFKRNTEHGGKEWVKCIGCTGWMYTEQAAALPRFAPPTVSLLAKRLRLARGNRRQKEIAELAQIDICSLSCYERGLRSPGAANLAVLAQVLGKSADWLLGLNV